jgi:membrane protease YdiL (CAAX protease family)
MGLVIPLLPADHPARPRGVDLLTDDHPLRPFPPLHRCRFAAWLRLLVFVVVGIAAMFGIAKVLAAAIATPGWWARWWVSPVTELIAAIAAFVVLLLLEGRRPVELAPRRLAGLAGGLVLGAVLLSAVIGALFVLGSYRIVGTNPGYNVWPALLSAGVTAAVAEEIAFRAVLFRLFEEVVGTWGALGASALLFGAAHLSNPDATLWGAIAIALEAGVLFAALYAVTRSLWWTIGLHFSWNMMQGPVSGSAVSGSGAASGWFQAQFTGPEWLTGGEFGIEASVVSVALLTLVGAALMHVIFRQSLAVRPYWARRRVLASRPEADTQQLAGPTEA